MPVIKLVIPSVNMLIVLKYMIISTLTYEKKKSVVVECNMLCIYSTFITLVQYVIVLLSIEFNDGKKFKNVNRL